jgi:hypothetical protein
MQTIMSNIKSEKRRGNLFINLSGTLNDKSAMKIKDSIQSNYNGTGNVFFNVEKIKIQHESPDSRRLLTDILFDCSLPPTKFFLIGQEGFNISPDGCKVIVRKKKNAAGNVEIVIAE